MRWMSICAAEASDMWIVYHVFPAVLAVSAGICLYISLCKLCETRTSWRRASALIAALAALFMLDLSCYCGCWRAGCLPGAFAGGFRCRVCLRQP